MPDIIIHKRNNSEEKPVVIVKYAAVVVKINADSKQKGHNKNIADAYAKAPEDSIQSHLLQNYRESQTLKGLLFSIKNLIRDNTYEIHIFPIDKIHEEIVDGQTVKQFIGDFLKNQQDYHAERQSNAIQVRQGEAQEQSDEIRQKRLISELQDIQNYHRLLVNKLKLAERLLEKQIQALEKGDPTKQDQPVSGKGLVDDKHDAKDSSHPVNRSDESLDSPTIKSKESKQNASMASASAKQPSNTNNKSSSFRRLKLWCASSNPSSSDASPTIKSMSLNSR